VRLRPLLPAGLRDRPVRDLVGAAQAEVDAAAPALLDLAERTLICSGVSVALPPLRAAFLAVLAQRPDGLGVADLPVANLCDAYRAAGASRATASDLSRRLADASVDAWLHEMVSRLQSRLRACLPLDSALRLAIVRTGRRPHSRYRMAPRVIVVNEPIRPT
jgi:hypothetical protein